MTRTGTRETIPLHPVDLGSDVGAWFTGRPADADGTAVGQTGNLSHRRPHVPLRLAAARREVCDRIGLDVHDLHFMQQVHGADVGVIDAGTPRSAELRQVDALVTAERERALVVQVADCVPVLLASDTGAVAAVHAGRRGVAAGVVEATLDRLEELGAAPGSLRGAIGPAIGGCCYEVPEELRDEVARDRPEAAAETSWGTPSLDLPTAVATVLRRRGVGDLQHVGSCTHCDAESRWFSHRRDPGAGRQVGIVVARTDPATSDDGQPDR